jgi:hypothetical protein
VGSLARAAFQNVPQIIGDDKELARRLREAVNLLLQGKLNCAADVTLLKDAISTTVSDVRAGPNSVILPMPTSPSGSMALTVWRVSTRTTGSFVFSHVSTSTSDATATYAIFG